MILTLVYIWLFMGLLPSLICIVWAWLGMEKET